MALGRVLIQGRWHDRSIRFECLLVLSGQSVEVRDAAVGCACGGVVVWWEPVGGAACLSGVSGHGDACGSGAVSGDRPDSEQRTGAGRPSYAPSALLADVMVVLLQRGITARLRGSDLPQAHQAAWTLLDVLGVAPDTSRCPCIACGGAEFQLARLDLVAEDHPALTGRGQADDADRQGQGPQGPPGGDEDEQPQ